MIARKDFTQQISKKASIGGLRTKNYSNDAFPEVLRSNFSQGCCRYPKNHSYAKTEAWMIPLRIVLDTNILVSAAQKPDGLQRTVLALAITPPARLYVSDAICAEYRAVRVFVRETWVTPVRGHG